MNTKKLTFSFFRFFYKDDSPKIYGLGRVWGEGGNEGGGNVGLVRDELESGLKTERVGLRDDFFASFRSSSCFAIGKEFSQESLKFRAFIIACQTLNDILARSIFCNIAANYSIHYRIKRASLMDKRYLDEWFINLTYLLSSFEICLAMFVATIVMQEIVLSWYSTIRPTRLFSI